MAVTPWGKVEARGASETRADSLVALARDAARREAHDEAIQRFEEALAASPEVRPAWLGELADQTLWAGRPEKAIPLYREVLLRDTLGAEQIRETRLHLALALSWSGRLDDALVEYDALLLENRRDRQALLERGRILSWRGRNGEAQACFEDLIHLNPYDYEAHRELGRILSWRGRYRQAQSHLRGVLAARPDDAEAVRLLARTQWWMGRPDRAMATLHEHLVTHRGDDRARDLLQEFEAAIRWSTLLRQRQSRQSDDLDIGISEFVQDFVFNEGLTTLGPRYQFQRYDPENGESIHVQRPGIFGRQRFSDAVEWTALAFVDRIDVQDSDVAHTRFTYSTWLTLWPNDFVRFDVGSDRSTLDNVPSLVRNIVATSFNLSMDLLPDETLRFVGRANWSDYTDGNGRLWGQIEAQRRWLGVPFLWGGVRSTAFHFRRLLDHGYFNPRDYVAVDATLRWFDSRTTKFRYRVDGSAGYEHSSPGGEKFIWSAGLQLDWSVSRHFGLGLQTNHFSSATASSSGFARTSAGASAQFLW